MYTHNIVDSRQRLLSYLHVICLFQTCLNMLCINCNLFPETCLVYTADRVSEAKSQEGGALIAVSDRVSAGY
jgi:hypothetical protein